MKTPLCLALPIALFLCGPAFAQVLDGSLTIPTDFELRNRGWSQLYNTEEMLEFLLAVFEAIAMTAVLAFHPKNIAHRHDINDFNLPRSMFLYALIGLVVGFLVIHHGVLIGFVVFGIGSLFRFRMETLSASDTAQLIFVALIGLSVGLDLPVMAMLLTIVAVIVVAVFARKSHMALEVKFEPAADFGMSMEKMKASLEKAGFSFVDVNKSKFKPVAEIVLSSTDSNGRASLVSEMTRQQKESGSGIEDWHIS